MLILAHRGFRSPEQTENTIEAFEAAVAHGADGVEFDLRLAKDGELVVVHDPTLSRIAGDGHKVAELSSTELAMIPLRHGGRISTLNEVTSTIHAPAILDMEVKTKAAVESLILKLKTSATLRERTIVSSFHMQVLKRVQQELPEVRTLLLVRWPFLRAKAFHQKLSDLRPWGVAFRLRLVKPRLVAKIKRMGIQVGAWDQRGTLREARHMAELRLDLAIVHHIKEIRAHFVSQ